MTKHFLELSDLASKDLHAVIERGIEIRRDLRSRGPRPDAPLRGRLMAMIFEKASTRTRASFEAAMAHLGGSTMFLDPASTQLGRGESVADSARVLSRMVDVVVVRTFSHERLREFAAHSCVPVVNALTDLLHPCQLLADIMTWQEHSGPVAGKKAAFIGDGNNVCNSWMNAAHLFGFRLAVATPSGYEPDPGIAARCGHAVTLTNSPIDAVNGADVVVTDTWASMGQEEETRARREAFRGFQVNVELMAHAGNKAIFMHCLPAYRGQEVTAEVIDGARSVVWDEAENRLHAQEALLEYLLA